MICYTCSRVSRNVFHSELLYLDFYYSFYIYLEMYNSVSLLVDWDKFCTT